MSSDTVNFVVILTLIAISLSLPHILPTPSRALVTSSSSLAASGDDDGITADINPLRFVTSSVGRFAYECMCDGADSASATASDAFPRGAVSDCRCDAESIESVNDPKGGDFFRTAVRLASRRYFRYFAADLLKPCPFWQDEALCGMSMCELKQCEEEEIPPLWSDEPSDDRVERLSAATSVSLPKSFGEWGELDPWSAHDLEAIREHSAKTKSKKSGSFSSEASSSPLGVSIAEALEPRRGEDNLRFFELLNNPERFTGYAGEDSHRIWRAVYEENCFDMSNEEEAQCVEKRTFYRLISGMHTSISTHLSWIFPLEDGAWGLNRAEYERRVATHRDRIENLYFLFSMLIRAVKKAGPHLVERPFAPTGNVTDDRGVVEDIGRLVSAASSPRACPETFDETAVFRGPEAAELKVQLRSRFYNISRILDCVGCQKCRLWGKIQVMGLGTALKILFADADLKDVMGSLTRSEEVAFINFVARISNSMHLFVKYREMVYQEKVQWYGTIVLAITSGLAILWATFCNCGKRKTRKMEKDNKGK